MHRSASGSLCWRLPAGVLSVCRGDLRFKCSSGAAKKSTSRKTKKVHLEKRTAKKRTCTDGGKMSMAKQKLIKEFQGR